MNKQCFRVIFSQTLQQLIVVSELAKSAGKAHSDNMHSLNVCTMPRFASLTPLAFRLFLALNFITFSSFSVADTLIIKADPNAPKNQQPIVLQTANGVPQINIQTPNNKGLSHNKYQDFNVANQGAVLNNSHKATTTQQAGWVQGNPYLARGEASVILNEVTSNHPSQLKGYVEVAGKKAEVIIANPNGLSCDGCGILNASRSTITTGQPLINDGNVAGFNVEKGTLHVHGKGLDNSQVDYTDLLAHEIKVNAGIWAGKKLNAVTGQNHIKQANITHADETLQISHQPNGNLSQQQTNFALDVSELGGMYAGKIHLIGTEHGLGVRNAGHIGASADALVINEKGNIVNKGTLSAAQEMTVNAEQGIENRGKFETKTQNIAIHSGAYLHQDGKIIARQGKINITAKNAIKQSGETVAKGKIDYQAANINATTSSVIATGVTTVQTAQGEMRQLEPQSAQGATLTIRAEQFTQLAGQNFSSGAMHITAPTINLDNSQNSAYEMMVNATVGDVTANHSKLNASENLTIATPTTLSTQHSQLTAQRIQTTQQDLNTQYALWQQRGQDEFQIKARTIQNQNGVLNAAGDVVVNANFIDNTAGKFIAGQQLNIYTTDSINSAQGTLFAHGDLSLKSGQLINDNGLIQSLSNMSINTNTGDISNKNTQTKDHSKGIVASGDLKIESRVVENNDGLIGTDKSLKLNAMTVNNTHGNILTAQDLTINAQAITNSAGIINGQQETTLQATQIDNKTGIIWGENVALNAANIDNQKRTFQGSLIGADKRLTIHTQQLNNQNTQATGTQPTQGLQATHLQIQADTFNNQQGGAYATATLTATLNQQLNNQQGEILAGGQIAIQPSSEQLIVNNQEGLLEAGQQLNLTAHSLQDEGTIKTAGNAVINLATDFTLNHAFQIGGKLNFTTAGDFANKVKLVVGNQAILTAKQLTNHLHAEISSKQTEIQSNTLTNYGLIDGENTFIHVDTLNNLGTGRIYGDHLAIQADQLNNLNDGEKSATLAARARLDLGVKNLINQDHSLILSLDQLAIAGALDRNHYAIGKAALVDNSNATIEALGNATINTARLWNHDRYIRFGENHTDEHRVEYAPKNASQRYVLIDKEGSHGYFNLKNNDRHDKNSYLVLNDGTTIAANGWMHWDYNRHTVTTTIEYRDPSKILIGGNLNLSGDNLENNASILSVGRQLHLGNSTFTQNDTNTNLTAKNGTVLKNIDIPGTINITDQGEWDSFAKHRRRYGSRGKKRWSVYGDGDGPYQDIHPTIHFTFNKVTNAIGKPIEGTSTSISSLTPVSAMEMNNTLVSLQTGMMSGEVAAHHPEQLGNDKAALIKTHLVDIRLPQASLYQINPEAPKGYLIETDPQFTQHKQWLSSDYMFDALRYEHENVHKRLGDGFYEQRLITDQIGQLTGRRLLDNYQSDIEQYQALMDNGIYYAKKFNLQLGVGLSAEQMAELTSDMVWLVNKTVTLPSGKSLTVLMPQVYLVARNLDVTSQGSLISAREIVGNLNGDIHNTGVIAGRNLTALSANNLYQQGLILGHSVNLQAQQQLINLGGKIQALDAIHLTGGTGVEIASTTSHQANADGFGNQFAHTNLDQTAQIQVSGEQGKLTIYSPQDVTLRGAQLSSQGTLLVQAKQLDIGTIQTQNLTDFNADADNYYRLKQQQEVGSQLQSRGDIYLGSTTQTHIRQSELHSDQGTLSLVSQGEIQIGAGRKQEQLASAAKVSHSGFLQSVTDTTKHQHRYDLAQGSNLDAQHLRLHSQQGDLTISGSNLVAEQTFMASAQNITVQETENRVFEQDIEKTSKSGLMGADGFGFSIGEKKTTTENEQTKYYATESQLGSLKGETTLLAQNHYQQQGSSVSALTGDLNIHGKQLDIVASADRYQTHYQQTLEQKGFTIQISAPVIQAVQDTLAAVEQAKQVGESNNRRINAMAVGNSAWGAYRAGQSLMKASESLSQMANGNMAQGANVSVSITYGEQKNVQTTDTQGNTANRSHLNAGGKVHLQATGAGEQSDINIIGADISGKQGTLLQAEHNIHLLAAEQTHQERSKNKSSGFNAGVAVSYGSNGFAFGVTAGGNYGKGYGNGDETTWLTSHLGDKASQTVLQSGNDTTLKGTQVRGKAIQLQAQNLNIESLQDTMKYEGKQMNVSGQVTVGYGFSGSASFNQSKMKADYASVQEQSGLFAGDEGYQIDIRNHTDLTGALITSTTQAETEGKNSFSTGTLSSSDIQNYSNYSAKGFGLSGGVTVSGGNAPKEIGGMKLQQIGQNAQDGSAKVEYSGVAGIGSQGNWGITKGISTALLGQVSDKSSENGVTTSAINTDNITIRNASMQKKLTGKSVEETLHDLPKINLHQHVEKADIETIRSDLERDLHTATEFVDNTNGVGDEIYYRIEKNEQNIYLKHKKEKDCQNIECIKVSEVNVNQLTVPKTKEEAELLARIYVHGIMNTSDQDRTPGAIQYGGKEYLNNDTLIVRKPYSSFPAELAFTVFERIRAGLDMPSIFGASNASRDQTKIWGLLDEYNRQNPTNQVDLSSINHSLGASSTKNAMNWARHEGMSFNNTTLNAYVVGTSYPITNNTLGATLSGGLYDKGYTETAAGLFRNGSVEYASAPRDIVATGINLPFVPGSLSIGIGNTNTTGSNKIGIPLWDMIMGNHTTAYYQDEEVIDFIYPTVKDEGKAKAAIINYQNKVWGKVGPKTETIEFNKSINKGNNNEKN